MTSGRVVITGVGPVSAIGIGREAFFSAWAEGRSGLVASADFDGVLTAPVSDFHVQDYLESEKTYLDRASELAFAAAALAFEDADLDPHALRPSDTALLLGSAYGNPDTLGIFFKDLVEKGPRLVKPILFPHTYSNTTISLLAMEYGLAGYHVSFSSGWTSSSLAIVEGFDLIRSGRAKVALVGGFEALSHVVVPGYEQSGWLVPKGAGARCVPLDPACPGFAPGEGAAILVLEDLENAQARGVPILAELAGCAVVSDSTVAQPGGGSELAEAMERTIVASTGAGRESVDAVLASANGLPVHDANEACILARYFNHAPWVTAPKALLGESMGAAGALHAVAALASIARQAIPPIPGLAASPSGLRCVVTRPEQTRVHRVLTHAIDPGGGMVTLLLQGIP